MPRTSSIPIGALLETVAAIGALAWLPASAAAPVGFTDRSQFDAAIVALGNSPALIGFDALADGTTISDGAAVDGLALNYDFGVVQVEVRSVIDASRFDTTSPPNYAGSDDGGVLQDGDDIVFTSEQPINALGITLTTADAMQTGDLVLSAGGARVELDPGAIQSVQADGSLVYFLGVVDDTRAFDSASLRGTGAGFFLYTLDDLLTVTARDEDGDTIADAQDNCTLVPNPLQIDSDADQIGNACDADIATPNDCIVNVQDLGVLRLAFFTNPGTPQWNPDADFTGDGAVNASDLGVMKSSFFAAPGPSGRPNPCAAN